MFISDEDLIKERLKDLSNNKTKYVVEFNYGEVVVKDITYNDEELDHLHETINELEADVSRLEEDKEELEERLVELGEIVW